MFDFRVGQDLRHPKSEWHGFRQGTALAVPKRPAISRGSTPGDAGSYAEAFVRHILDLISHH